MTTTQDLQMERVERSRPAADVAAPARLPRVLYVVNTNPSGKFGSMEEQIVFLHRAFAAEGSRFLPLYSCPSQLESTDGFRAYGIETRCLNLREFRWRTLFALRSLCAEHGVELIHWQFTEPVANPYVWCLALLNPTIRHFYSDRISRLNEPYAPPTGWKKALKRFLLQRYAQTWCVSRFVKDCLAEQGTWSNVRVNTHFINTDRFVPNARVRAEMRRQYGVQDRFVVAVVAQLIPEKGIDVALQAMTEVSPNAVLWIIGAGSQEAELQTLARSLGVQERVRFLGLQRHVEPFLQAADCFVLPSRWKEAAGLVLLEAQSTGLPVVASRIGGIPEYVAEGRSGFLFTPNNAHDLARYLRVLGDDPVLCRRMGRQARAVALETFSAQAQMGNWLENYRQFRQSLEPTHA